LIAEIAKREGFTGRYVALLLDLAFLPPALVQDVGAGRQPVEMTAETPSRSERPLLWANHIESPCGAHKREGGY
jgi:hypothetical protein